MYRTITGPVTKQAVTGKYEPILRSEDALGEPGASFGTFSFEVEGVEQVIAVVDYEGSATFTPADWQGPQPQTWEEIPDYDWADESGRRAVLLDGLPVKGL